MRVLKTARLDPLETVQIGVNLRKPTVIDSFCASFQKFLTLPERDTDLSRTPTSEVLVFQ
jgi:hypothetical protein